MSFLSLYFSWKWLTSNPSGRHLSLLVVKNVVKFWRQSTQHFWDCWCPRIENEKSARSLHAWSFSETPSGHGRPRLWVKDFCANNYISCTPRDGVSVFGPGRPPGYPPGRPRNIRPKTFCLGCYFPFLKESDQMQITRDFLPNLTAKSGSLSTTSGCRSCRTNLLVDDRQITHPTCVRLRHLLYDFF